MSVRPRRAWRAPSGLSSYADVARGLASGRVDESLVRERLAFIDARKDLSDHRMLLVLKLLLDCPDELPDGLREDMRRTVLGFRYWMDEPGNDSMCHFSESHQLLFSVCEQLAGQLFPDQVFTNDGRKGHRKAARGRERLLEWMGNRFRLGFSEWLSHTYYELDVAGLVLLVDHTLDEELRLRASIILDLIMLDLALHRFDGRFIASAGRANAIQKARPEKAEINEVLAAAFGEGFPFDPDDPSSLFLTRRRYQVPEVIVEIANAEADHLITCSNGLDASEVPWEVQRRPGLDPHQRRDALVNLFWSMGAFSTPESIEPTLEAIERFEMQGNTLLHPLGRLARLPRTRLMGGLLRAVNPVTRGIALQRANVQTYRTPHYLLTSAQHYQVGCFGDQEHLWQAALPGDITVFSTHPGATRLVANSRQQTPSAWVGNGINPDIGQDRNVLLALHDLGVRRGYLEGRRNELSHLYFPSVKFDEFKIGDRFVAGRRDDSFIGVVALNPIEMISEDEILQRGTVTGWAVMMADRSEFGSLARLVDHLKRTEVRHAHEALVWHTPEHVYRLAWKGSLRVDGQAVDTFYPRLHCEWTHVPRNPSLIQLEGAVGKLMLDWKLGTRMQLPPDC